MGKHVWISVPALFAAATIGSAFADDNTHAGHAVTEAVQASGHASASAAHSIAASGQVTSAVSALPLSVGGVALGSAGAVSAGAARDSMRAATAPIGTPLEITDEAITVIPPNEALKAKSKAAKP
jgi:hypothetical protein